MTSPGMAMRFGRPFSQPKGGQSPFSPLQSKSLGFGGRIVEDGTGGAAGAAGGKRRGRKHESKFIRADDASGAAADPTKVVAAGDLQPGWAPVRRTTDDRTLQPLDRSQSEQREKLIAASDATAAAVATATATATANKNYDSVGSNAGLAATVDSSASGISLSVPTGSSLNKGDGKAGEVLPPKRSEEESNAIMSGYMWGQVANVGRFGVWWVALGPLILALFNGSSYGVGGARVAYNAAMFIFSPIAGAMAERVAIRYLLNLTTTFRLVLYVALFPLSFVFLRSGWVFDNSGTGWTEAFYVVFLTLMFFDGMMIAFANVVDIDCGGTDLIAAQYNAVVNDGLRNRFNSIHEAFFNLSMLAFAPLMAWVALFAVQHWSNAQDAAAIGGTLAFVFLTLSLVSLYQYNVHIPKHTTPANNAPKPSGGVVTITEASSLWADMRSGMLIVWNSQRIRWRIIFLALETACEDAMVSLVIAEYAIGVLARSGDGDINFAKGNLLAAAIVACGKAGAILSSYIMNRIWASTLDKDGKASDASFKPLFYMVFAGGLSSLLLPIGNMLQTNDGDSAISYVLIFLGSFLFFLFSTAPKIGFGTLMQSLAAEVDASGRIFGFITCVITATDSLVLLLFSLLFSTLSLTVSMWCCCGFIALHGLCEVIFGPWLVLGSPAAAKPSAPAAAAAASVSSAPAGASSAADDKALKRPLLSDEDIIGVSSPANTSSQPNSHQHAMAMPTPQQSANGSLPGLGAAAEHL